MVTPGPLLVPGRPELANQPVGRDPNSGDLGATTTTGAIPWSPMFGLVPGLPAFQTPPIVLDPNSGDPGATTTTGPIPWSPMFGLVPGVPPVQTQPIVLDPNSGDPGAVTITGPPLPGTGIGHPLQMALGLLLFPSPQYLHVPAAIPTAVVTITGINPVNAPGIFTGVDRYGFDPFPGLLHFPGPDSIPGDMTHWRPLWANVQLAYQHAKESMGTNGYALLQLLNKYNVADRS
jgi:hypothetical protein